MQVAQRVKISDRVFSELREAILTGELAQGSLHSIYELAGRFAVSRTPVRDAALRLADTGMVEIERNRGIRIRGVGVADIRSVFELRLLLEVPATAFAAEHGDENLYTRLDGHVSGMRAAAALDDSAAFMLHDYALHDAILSVMANPRLNEQVRGLRDVTQVMGASTFNRSRELREVEREHEPIVHAIRRSDPAGAAESMAHHLVATGTLLMTQVAGVDAAVAEDWASPARDLFHAHTARRRPR